MDGVGDDGFRFARQTELGAVGCGESFWSHGRREVPLDSVSKIEG